MQVSIVPAGEALCQLGGFEALSVGSVVRVLATWAVQEGAGSCVGSQGTGEREGWCCQSSCAGHAHPALSECSCSQSLWHSGSSFLSFWEWSWCSVPCRQLVLLGRQGRCYAVLESCVLPGGPRLEGSPCPGLCSLLCIPGGFEILVLRAAVLPEAQAV